MLSKRAGRPPLAQHTPGGGGGKPPPVARPLLAVWVGPGVVCWARARKGGACLSLTLCVYGGWLCVWCMLVLHWCMLRGWLAHVLLSLAMWSGVVCGWLAVWLAVCMSVAVWLAVCMALWLAGSLALLETKAIFAGKFQLLFSAFSASKSPQNPLKIAAKSAEIFADFSPILALQKPKPKNPKPKISIKNPQKKTQKRKPKKENPKPKKRPPKPCFDGG